VLKCVVWEREDWIIWFKIGAIAGLFADSDEASCSLNAENVCYL
jgi:hypothetical protein